MLTVYTSLKPNNGRIGDIQQRSQSNWQQLGFRIECLSGPVDFRDVVHRAEESETAISAWVNGDILFEQFILDNIMLPATSFRKWLLIGRRIDELPDGRRLIHKPSGIDYFVFPKGVFENVPEIIMGRGYCDSAIITHCLRSGIPVIDATACVRAIHQWHDYAHHAAGKPGVMEGDDAQRNLQCNRLRPFAPHIADATHKITERGLCANWRSPLRRLEWWGYYVHGWEWWPNFNQLWNILHRGGTGVG